MDDLTHLFSAYFYEAWKEHEYLTWGEAVDDFALRSPEKVPGAAGGLRELLAQDIDDAELAQHVQSRGCTFVSSKGVRVWLYLLLDRLDQEMSMEALPYLMGAYFHQDFDLDGGESSDTVAVFLLEPRELVERCVQDIDGLLERSFPRGGLTARLDAWGCQYYPGETDGDYRMWLCEIRDQMHSFLTSTSNG